MKNKILAVGAVLLIVGGGLYVFREPGHIPMFDADIQRLAETAREGYCAGRVYWKTGGGGDETAAKECRASDTQSTEIDLSVVQLEFCWGVISEGYSGNAYGCRDYLQTKELWPTYIGQLTDAWTKAYPYPGGLLKASTNIDDSRTGIREGLVR
jgi:hypothetical protein